MQRSCIGNPRRPRFQKDTTYRAHQGEAKSSIGLGISRYSGFHF